MSWEIDYESCDIVFCDALGYQKSALKNLRPKKNKN